VWWIKNAHLVDPAQGVSGIRNVLVKDGRIKAIGEDISERKAQELLGAGSLSEINIVDGTGKYLFPGLVDVHVHLREPGFEEKEDILSGSRAAVRGGFTSIMAMANTAPVIDTRAMVEFVLLQGQRAGKARVYTVGAVTKGLKGEELVEMMDLKEGGASAFSDDGKGIQSAEMMRLALEYAKLTGMPIIAHCEDETLAAKGAMRKGETSARLGLKGIPASSESVMVARDIILAGETGGKLHIAHVSTKESVEMIRVAKTQGLDITAEVNPYHLIFTCDDVKLTDSSYKVNPPLPSREDQEALLQGILDGTIDMLATDHAPHTWEEKARPFGDTPFGINGLETVLAAVWQTFVAKGIISPEKLIELWSVNPARRFGWQSGTLKAGQAADMVLFDPDRKEVIAAADMESKSSNTLYLGKEMQGLPIMTWVEGNLVMQNRKVV
jgi:dihydroorotase